MRTRKMIKITVVFFHRQYIRERCTKYEDLFHCLPLVSVLSCHTSSKIQQEGEPWHNEIQQIPGRIEFEYYDEGGEGIAYHDSDAVNIGSGKLNPANGTYLNESG